VEEEVRHREEALKAFQDELAAFEAKEESLTSAYREKKKEHAHALRELKKSRERVHQVQQQIDGVEPQSIQIRQQVKYSQKKLEEAQFTESQMKKKVTSKATELQALHKDVKDLSAAKAELEAKRAGSQGDEQELIMDATRLEEYHRIKESVQVKTNLLRNELDSIMRQQHADQNKVQTLQQEKSEHEKTAQLLTEDLQKAADRIRNVREPRLSTFVMCCV
jgi:chromosome segregation ATPase